MKSSNNSKNIAAQTEVWATEIASSFGLNVWDTEFKKEGADWVLRVYIDSDEKSISTDDCEKVSRALEEILDRENPIEQAYMLEVSSPGIERVLTRPEHFKKYINNKVSVKLFKEINGKKLFSGILLDYDNGNVTVQADHENITFEQKAAALIRLDVF